MSKIFKLPGVDTKGVVEGGPAQISGTVADIMNLANKLPILNDAVAKKNIIKVSEFKKYLPLFNVKECEKLTEEESTYLGDQLRRRISFYQPLTIISDQKNEKDEYELIAQFPAFWDMFSELSAGTNDETLIPKFIHASATDSPLSTRLCEVGIQMQEALVRANQRRAGYDAKNEELAKNLRNKALSDNPKAKSDTEQSEMAEYVDDMPWE